MNNCAMSIDILFACIRDAFFWLSCIASHKYNYTVRQSRRNGRGMAMAYSEDLRKRVLSFVARSGSKAEAARVSEIHLRTVFL
jgi:Transposase